MKALNIPNLLLSALVGLGAITLSIIHDDARDLVQSLHTVAEKQNTDHAQIGVNVVRIDKLEDSDMRQWSEIAKKVDKK